MPQVLLEVPEEEQEQILQQEVQPPRDKETLVVVELAQGITELVVVEVPLALVVALLPREEETEAMANKVISQELRPFMPPGVEEEPLAVRLEQAVLAGEAQEAIPVQEPRELPTPVAGEVETEITMVHYLPQEVQGL